MRSAMRPCGIVAAASETAAKIAATAAAAAELAGAG